MTVAALASLLLHRWVERPLGRWVRVPSQAYASREMRAA
jgi:hypothetical protein